MTAPASMGRTEKETADATERAQMGLEAMADRWAAENGIDGAINAAAKAAGPHASKLASVIHGLVTQAFMEGALAGFYGHKDLIASRAVPPRSEGEDG